MANSDPLTAAHHMAPDGLDHVFGGGEAPAEGINDHESPDVAGGLSAAQAAFLAGTEQGYVIKLIRQGKLCGRRDKVSRKWIISLECFQSWLKSKDRVARPEAKPDEQAEGDGNEIALASQVDGNDGMRALWYKLDIAVQQLRAASYRIGYLESQAEQYREQIKLLPDLQAEAARAASAGKEVEELREKLSDAQAQLERIHRPWWQRLF